MVNALLVDALVKSGHQCDGWKISHNPEHCGEKLFGTLKIHVFGRSQTMDGRLFSGCELPNTAFTAWTTSFP
jgi:hypothetical protein